MGFERFDTERGEDHHAEPDGGNNHTIGNLAGSRGFFAASTQPAEERHTDRGETYYEAGVELLEDGSGNFGFCGYVQPEHNQQGGANEYHHGGDDTVFRRFALDYCESGINRHDAEEQSAHVKEHGRNAGGSFLREFCGEVGQRKTVLVEGHPEEDDNGEDEAEGDDASARIGRRKFHCGFLFCGFFGGIGLFLLTFDVAEGGTRNEIDDHRDDQRDASHGKSEVIAVGFRETDALRVFHDFHSCTRGEERADVDCHVENGERCIALSGKFGTLIKVADHHLEVTFEKSCSHTNQRQCTDDGDHRHGTVAQGEGQ